MTCVYFLGILLLLEMCWTVDGSVFQLFSGDILCGVFKVVQECGFHTSLGRAEGLCVSGKEEG